MKKAGQQTGLCVSDQGSIGGGLFGLSQFAT